LPPLGPHPDEPKGDDNNGHGNDAENVEGNVGYGDDTENAKGNVWHGDETEIAEDIEGDEFGAVTTHFFFIHI
jgi:hypothetical protein